MSRETVTEGSTAWLAIAFLDRAGQAQAPATVTYRIDCLTTGQVMRADTALPAAVELEIVLSPTDNRIVDPAHATERRRVTVRAENGADDAVNSEFHYDVRNLGGVT